LTSGRQTCFIGGMKTCKTIMVGCVMATLALPMLDCAGHEARPQKPQATGEKPPAQDKDRHSTVAMDDDAESSGLVDLQRSRDLLKNNKLDDLLEIFEPRQVPRLTRKERSALADIFYRAAMRLRKRYKDISYSSMFCERGLMLDEAYQPLMRLQIRNYLHSSMKLFGGAEELAVKLVQIDPANQENQFLRGKVAYDQGEWDVAAGWLKKAARVGRTENSKLTKDAWHLQDLAKGHLQELKASLSMTRELELMLKHAKIKNREQLMKNPPPAEMAQPAALAGGKIVLYMTNWCGYCRKTKELLESLKVPFEQKDIEKNQSALMEMMRAAEQAGVEVTGVPVIRIGSKLVVGYNPQRIEELVRQIR